MVSKKDLKARVDEHKAAITSANDAGTRIAAPAPCTMREAMSRQTDGENPHAIEAAVNTAEPIRNTLRWPSRSASLPAGTNRAAKAMVYAFNTHDRVDTDESPNVALMSGNATKRMVVSR